MHRVWREQVPRQYYVQGNLYRVPNVEPNHVWNNIQPMAGVPSNLDTCALHDAVGRPLVVRGCEEGDTVPRRKPLPVFHTLSDALSHRHTAVAMRIPVRSFLL